MASVTTRYVGELTDDGFVVWVCDVDGADFPLPLRHDLVNHSAWFEWGRNSPGSAQLAIALCAHVLQDDGLAKECYMAFRDITVDRLLRLGWELSVADIIGKLADMGWC